MFTYAHTYKLSLTIRPQSTQPRKLKRRQPPPDRLYQVTAIKFWEKSSNSKEDWFLTQWFDEEEDSLTRRKDFFPYEPWKGVLNIAETRGNMARGMTKVGGRKNAAGMSRVRMEPAMAPNLRVDKRSSEAQAPYETVFPSISFFSVAVNCVPYSLLNVIEASKTQAKKLKKALKANFCGLRDLACVTREVLKISLKKHKTKTPTFLLDQKTGKWLVMQKTHCVGIDAEKGWIYDPSLTTVLPLTLDNLHSCGFNTATHCYVREVVR